MNRLFCDTLYFIALVNPKDQWHQPAIRIEPLVETVDLITTEEVLIEFLNFYSEFGSRMRFEVSTYVRQLLLNPKFNIVGRGEISFLDALELYESLLDKGYSLPTAFQSMSAANSVFRKFPRTITILSRKE